MAKVNIVYPAGRVEFMKQTYPAAKKACKNAGAILVPIAWSTEAAKWFKSKRIKHTVNIGGTLQQNVESFLLNTDSEFVGRIDDDTLVADQTIVELFDSIGDNDAVAAWAFKKDPPYQENWSTKLVPGTCHIARRSAVDDKYSEWFPKWAKSKSVTMSPVRVTHLDTSVSFEMWADVVAGIESNKEIVPRAGEFGLHWATTSQSNSDYDLPNPGGAQITDLASSFWWAREPPPFTAGSPTFPGVYSWGTRIDAKATTSIGSPCEMDIEIWVSSYGGFNTFMIGKGTVSSKNVYMFYGNTGELDPDHTYVELKIISQPIDCLLTVYSIEFFPAEPSEPVTPLPALDFTIPIDRNVYLDLVANDHPLGGWSPGYFVDELTLGRWQIVPNYYGEQFRKEIISPPGTSGGYKLQHGDCT